jgi:hypothetical protein
LATSLGDRLPVMLAAEKPENERALPLDMQAAFELCLPNTLHIVVKNSGHDIQLEALEAVVNDVQASSVPRSTFGAIPARLRAWFFIWRSAGGGTCSIDTQNEATWRLSPRSTSTRGEPPTET